MTERDQETGQFTAAEPLYGLQAIEAEAGYVHLPKEPEPEELTVAEAAEQLASRTPEAEIVTHGPIDKLPENLALTVEEAAKIYDDRKSAEESQAQSDADEALRKEVDELRGIKSEDEEKPAETAEQAEQPEQTEEARREDGADPEIVKALENPKVKAAIEQQIGQTEAARQQYETALHAATSIAQAAFMSQFSELAGLPDAQRAEVLANNPALVARINAAGQNFQQLLGAQQAAYQQQESQRAADFAEYAKKEDARFADMVKGETPEEMGKIEREIIAALTDYGSDAKAFFDEFKTSPFLRNATVQRFMVDAAKYRLIQKAAKPIASRPVPHVQKPGVAPSKGDRAAVSIAALNEKLSQSGSVDDAYALYQAKKRARG